MSPWAWQRPAEVALILQRFNSLTPENNRKMGPIHPEENRYSWGPADAIVDFAQAQQLRVQRVGHNERDAYPAGRRLGSPAEPTPARVRTLRAATQPAPTRLPAQRLAAGAALTQMLALRTNEVVLLRALRR